MSKACEKAFEQLLKVCAIDQSLLGTPIKRKRTMSGYNCFIKNIYAVEKQKAKIEERKPIEFKEIIKMKTWNTLPVKQKSIWHDLALQNCPVVKDPLNV